MKDYYFKTFRDEFRAKSFCATKNRALRTANNTKESFVVVIGPECDWAVVDTDTAILMQSVCEIVG